MRAAPQCDVAAYYRRKTAGILKKYGPGPRVHFHTGVVSQDDLNDLRAQRPSRAVLSRYLVSAQEALLELCSDLWGAEGALSGHILDVGCGLGGGAIFWAERTASKVTALTNIAHHARLTESFAAEAGVKGRVAAVVSDAHEVCSAVATFDAAVAIESSCYFDRRRWFRALRAQLRPGGRVHVVDCLRVDDSEACVFDAYWRCRLGSLQDYLEAARAAGFFLVSYRDLSRYTARFWEASALYGVVARNAVDLDDLERRRLADSVVAHKRFHRAFRTGALPHVALVMERSAVLETEKSLEPPSSAVTRQESFAREVCRTQQPA